MNHLRELLKVSKQLGFASSCITGDDAKKYIDRVFYKFNPEKKTGHLAIGGNTISISAEKYDSTYSKYLPSTSGLVFFEQNHLNRDSIFAVDNISLLCEIMDESYGMEYFVSNKNIEFLIAVNWYSIEIKGDIKDRFLFLE